ncbi:hypothetical protein M433DRAFT_156172 [Acidomyces richmondensis BFW]|nr:MAG: hypothetical protein FE78DRAFT_92816 [Acidomyces sp. 'richmondensis']KYG43916.1 hypothetical protein M433DRAFT_156172 [Acidomyces richmondensis BFW]
MASHFLPLRTPEALLGRNDSKNPATTCRGITSSGRPCRRALASPKCSPARKRSEHVASTGGTAAIMRDVGENVAAEGYCWQHKAQADRTKDEGEKGHTGKPIRERSTELHPLQERDSIDTLVQRLGIKELSEEPGKKHNDRVGPRSSKPMHMQDSTSQRPNKSNMGIGPSFDEDAHCKAKGTRKAKKPNFWESLCCMTGGDDDYVEIVRHKKRLGHQARPATEMRPALPLTFSERLTPRQGQGLPRASMLARKSTQTCPVRPAHQRRSASNSQTAQLLSLIPPHLSPQTTSALLGELIKPISLLDEEGYIYIFWLTLQSKAAPGEETARSLLSPPAPRPHFARSISDVMTEFSFDGSEPATRGKKTIMLKIGRASNVTRRMNEWQRQCGYALNLVRWYPYVSSSASPAPSPSQSVRAPRSDTSRLAEKQREGDIVKKVPFVKRVERLVHLELQEKQVKRQCEVCGAEHREWFEVPASQAGVKAVDECVRRWVRWAERQVTR